MHPTEQDFIPWEKHRDEYVSFDGSHEEKIDQAPYSKEEILDYHKLCLEQMEAQVEALDLEAESGFYWLPFNKLELQFYNIRHLQQHTGELCERLSATGEVELKRVGMKPAD